MRNVMLLRFLIMTELILHLKSGCNVKNLNFQILIRLLIPILHWTKYGPQIIFEKKTTAMQIFITKEKKQRLVIEKNLQKLLDIYLNG